MNDTPTTGHGANAYEMRLLMERRMMNPVKERELLSTLVQGTAEIQAEILEHLRVHHMTSPIRGRMVEWAMEMQVDQRGINRVSFWDYIAAKNEFAQQDLDDEYHIIAMTIMEDTIDNTLGLLTECYKTRMVYYEIGINVQQGIVGNLPIDEVMARAGDVLIALDDASTKKQRTTAEHATNALDRILNPRKEMLGLMLGINAVDEQFGGLNRDTLITIGGFSGSGKTALVCDWIYRLGKHYPTEVAVCFFSLEMSEERIIRRLYSRIARITEYRLKNHARGGEFALSPDEQSRLLDAYAEVRDYPLEIIYEAGIDARAIKMKARKFALKNKGKQLVFILDHLGEVNKASMDARMETDKNMQAMKDLCIEYDATGVVLTQLKKEVEDQKNRPYCRPNRSHVMESVGVIAKSDVLILLWRPEVYVEYMPFRDEEEWPTAGKQIWLIEKNRDGHAPNDVIVECDIKYNVLDNYIEPAF
jgi:replicative DNA helicase